MWSVTEATDAIWHMMTTSSDVGCQVATTPRLGRCLDASIVPATKPLLQLSPTSNSSEPQVRSLVPSLPHIEERERFQACFQNACPLLTCESVADWQQWERSVEGSHLAMKWGEYQEAVLRQERFHSDADCAKCLPLEHLPQRPSIIISGSESETRLSPTCSVASVSSFASTAALELATETVNTAATDWVRDWPDALLRGSSEACSAEQQGSSFEMSPQQKRFVTPEHFDMSALD